MKKHTTQFKNEIKLLGKQQDIKITYGNTTLNNENITSIKFYYKGNLLKSIMKGLEIEANINIPIKTQIRFKYGLLVNGAYEYIDFGDYIVKDIEKKEDSNTYIIKCYDKMLLSMKDYENLNITYPITIKNYVIALCNKIGMEFKNANESFTNSDKMIPNELYLDSNGKNLGFTYRDILDDIAEVTASSICINKDNQIEIANIFNTNDTIDEEYLKDVNVKFGEKVVINSVVLSRAGADNIFRKDNNSVQKNGLYEIKIIDNQIMNQNNRDEFIDNIFNKLNGIEFYLNDYSSTGIIYYDFLDRYNIKIKDKIYSCIMFNDEIEITQGLQENIYTEKLENSETDYSKADKTDRRINQTTLIVDKHNKQINGLITDVGDRSNKKTSITADIDGLYSKVEDIEDLTAKVEGNNQILLKDSLKGGQIVELHIYGSNYKVKKMFPKENLYPKEDLYPTHFYPTLFGNSTLFSKTTIFGWSDEATKITISIKNEKDEEKIFGINLSKPLKQKDGICDEYILKNGIGKIIRRIDDEGNIKPIPSEEIIGELIIPLFEGNNIVSLQGYESKISVVYVPKNNFTETFATNIELKSQIKQTSDEISLEVSKKVGDDEIVSKINQSAEKVQIDANKISLNR